MPVKQFQLTVISALFGVALIAACGQLAHAFQPTPTFEDRDFGFNVQTEYFSTEANLSQGGGGYATLGGGRSFETLSARMAADYKLQSGWRAAVGGEVINAKSTDILTDRNNTELNSVFIESMYVLRRGRFLLAPQARYTQSLAEVAVTDDTVIAGEGTNQFELGGWGSMKAGPFEPYFYVAYRSQNDGRANMMPFQVGAKYYYQKLYAVAEIYGQSPLSNDRYTNQSYVRTSQTTLRNAGSLRFYSTNQSFYEGRSELGYKFTPDFTIYGGAGHTIDGKNAAYGLTISGGLLYTFGGVVRTSESFADDDEADTDFTEDEIAREYRKKQPKKRRPKKEKFEPLRDDYDESLFTPSN